MLHQEFISQEELRFMFLWKVFGTFDEGQI